MNVEDEAYLAIYDTSQRLKDTERLNGGFCPEEFLAVISERLSWSDYQKDLIRRNLEFPQSWKFVYPDAVSFFESLPKLNSILPVFFSQGEPPIVETGKSGFQKLKILDSGLVEVLGEWWNMKSRDFKMNQYVIGVDKNKELDNLFSGRHEVFSQFSHIDYIDDRLFHLEHAKLSARRNLNRDINLFHIDRKRGNKYGGYRGYSQISSFDDYVEKLGEAYKGEARLLFVDWDRTCWDTDGWKNSLKDRIIGVHANEP